MEWNRATIFKSHRKGVTISFFSFLGTWEPKRELQCQRINNYLSLRNTNDYIHKASLVRDDQENELK